MSVYEISATFFIEADSWSAAERIHDAAMDAAQESVLRLRFAGSTMVETGDTVCASCGRKVRLVAVSADPGCDDWIGHAPECKVDLDRVTALHRRAAVCPTAGEQRPDG